MFKKWLTVFAIVISPSLVYAFSYPYAGGGLGMQFNGNYRGLNANFLGGYGTTIGESESFYVGGEAFTSLLSLPISNESDQTNRVSFSLGAAFIPGMFITPNTMLYGRLGIETNRFQKSGNGSTGTQLGLGVQTNFNLCWDVRVEYAYTSSGVIPNFGSTRKNQINLAVVYKFLS